MTEQENDQSTDDFEQPDVSSEQEYANECQRLAEQAQRAQKTTLDPGLAWLYMGQAQMATVIAMYFRYRAECISLGKPTKDFGSLVPLYKMSLDMTKQNE